MAGKESALTLARNGDETYLGGSPIERTKGPSSHNCWERRFASSQILTPSRSPVSNGHLHQCVKPQSNRRWRCSITTWIYGKTASKKSSRRASNSCAQIAMPTILEASAAAEPFRTIDEPNALFIEFDIANTTAAIHRWQFVEERAKFGQQSHCIRS